MPIEDIEFSHSQFDVVISSLAFHYIKSFGEICKKVHDYLKPDGTFIFLLNIPYLLPEMNRIGILMIKEIVYIGQWTIINQRE